MKVGAVCGVSVRIARSSAEKASCGSSARTPSTSRGKVNESVASLTSETACSDPGGQRIKLTSVFGASMPRISGIDIPADKPIWISLTYIYGVGRTNSKQILKEAGIESQRRAKELSRRRAGQDHRHHRPGHPGRRCSAPADPAEHRTRFKDISSYRGYRHRAALPVRGQRTRSNARVPQRPSKDCGRQEGRQGTRQVTAQAIQPRS